MKLGKTKIFSNPYYIYYSYNLTNILTEYRNLKRQKESLQNILQQGTTDNLKELETHKNILIFNFNRLMNKVNIIFNHRNKRGAINGLGSIIKVISGNLDAADGERYEKLFKQIKQNENKLQNQNLENIRINKELTTNFNKQLQNIKFNELNLKSKIGEIESFIKNQMEWQQIFSIKDVFNQLINVSIDLIEIIDEIETSLSFCNLNLIHSSIISPKDLFNITKQIFEETKLSFQNFWSFSKLIRSHCKVSGNMIEYLLEIPLYSETNYDLYQLTAIPTIVKNKIITLNIPQQLIYKDNYKIYDVTSCIFNNGYYCKTNYIEKNECISQLFQNHLNLEECHYHEIEKEFHMYQIEKSPYIIIVSPDTKLISIECPNYSRKINVKGIYKFNNKNDCRINDICFSRQINGQESIFENFEIRKLTNIINTTSIIKLNDIKEMNVKYKNIPVIEELNVKSNHYVYIYVIIFLLLIVMILLKLTPRIRKLLIKKNVNDNETNLTNLQLPNEASF
ncbi:putative envelope protein [Lampyris noctiluca errantivirus 1]|nr:putative envelope protein [Lampyris noctiluca errantivirus 1]